MGPILKENLKPLITFFVNLLITIIHEQANYYLKILIYFNSFIYNKNSEILSDKKLLLEKEDNKIYLNILKYTATYNSKENSVKIPNEIDWEHRLEI